MLDHQAARKGSAARAPAKRGRSGAIDTPAFAGIGTEGVQRKIASAANAIPAEAKRRAERHPVPNGPGLLVGRSIVLDVGQGGEHVAADAEKRGWTDHPAWRKNDFGLQIVADRRKADAHPDPLQQLAPAAIAQANRAEAIEPHQEQRRELRKAVSSLAQQQRARRSRPGVTSAAH